MASRKTTKPKTKFRNGPKPSKLPKFWRDLVDKSTCEYEEIDIEARAAAMRGRDATLEEHERTVDASIPEQDVTRTRVTSFVDVIDFGLCTTVEILSHKKTHESEAIRLVQSSGGDATALVIAPGSVDHLIAGLVQAKLQLMGVV